MSVEVVNFINFFSGEKTSNATKRRFSSGPPKTGARLIIIASLFRGAAEIFASDGWCSARVLPANSSGGEAV